MPGGGRTVPDPQALIGDGPLALFGEERRGPCLAPLEVAAGPVREEDLRRDAAALDARCAAVGVPLSGGAARLLSPATADTLRAAVDTVARLAGRFYLAPGKTAAPPPGPFVLGHRSGDPSPWTALGVFAAIEACVGTVRGARVVVLGAGRVGSRLVRLLLDGGAHVLAADLDPARAAATGAEIRSPGDLLAEECDVLSPNARGFRFSEAEVGRLRCRFIAGSQPVVDWTERRGIVAVPESISGSGWLTNLAAELSPGGYSEAEARRLTLAAARPRPCGQL